MFARVVTFTAASDIDGGIRFVRDTVAPLLHQQNGFGSLTASADRARGILGVLTTWQTEADRDASESAVAKARDEGAHVIGGTMTVEMFEELQVEMAGPPTVGSALLVRRLSMDPAAIDANAEHFTRTVLPQITAMPGFLALRQMINRTTGDGLLGTAWADVAAMQMAAESAEGRREQAAAQGVTLREQTKREIVLIDMP